MSETIISKALGILCDICNITSADCAHYPCKLYMEMEQLLSALSSAQLEIIHCKECKYGVQDEDERWYCRGFGCQVGEEDGSGFCADAERRVE